MRGVEGAVKEFPLSTGEADYLLFVDRKAVGVVEAKPEGVTLSGVAQQAAKYSVGLPANIPHVTLPLPFLYESTGVEIYFRDERDPEPRSRRVFTFHHPEELADLLIDGDTLQARLRNMPTQFPLITTGLWGAQIEAIYQRVLALDFMGMTPYSPWYIYVPLALCLPGHCGAGKTAAVNCEEHREVNRRSHHTSSKE